MNLLVTGAAAAIGPHHTRTVLAGACSGRKDRRVTVLDKPGGGHRGNVPDARPDEAHGCVEHGAGTEPSPLLPTSPCTTADPIVRSHPRGANPWNRM